MEGGPLPLPKLRLERQSSDVRQIAHDHAHPPRAGDMAQLRQMQKAAPRERDEAHEGRKVASLSDTLRSGARRAGPRVIRGTPHECYSPGSPRVTANQSSRFVKAMSDAGLKPVVVYHNLSAAELYEKALQFEPSSHIVAGGALATMSGAKTGRSPQDKRIVREAGSEGDVWWGEGSPNHEMDERTFALNRERAVDYLNQLDRLYVCDGYACWEPTARYRIRIVCGRPYHALFSHNLLIRPTEEELAEQFGRPDFTIFNAGAFPANRFSSYQTSSTCISMSFARKEMVILGSQYAGNMKQGVFTLMNYWLPKRNILSLNAGCNVGSAGDVTLFFGLSGTGKTTFATDPQRWLLADDTLGWGENGVFGIEGGCYAKCIGLDKEREPGIHAAIRFGAVLENVCFNEDSREVDWDASQITENTRAAYPLEFMANARIPCLGGHPRNAVLLCCDLFGVLPPVCRLSLHQALYFFISGFTAKMAGTEQGVSQPEATFSACYTSTSLVWHPLKYAAMLGSKLEQHGTDVWLVNTGWFGGGYGVGRRLPLEFTRAIVAAIHSGELAAAACQTLPVFNLQVPVACSGMPSELLSPIDNWEDKETYRHQLRHLAGLFADNFQKLKGCTRHMSPEDIEKIEQAGPSL
ncbi:hypothetical protein D9Q98_005175 [Chlorella vulgaris]|uniref:phosphoenolpyruvate carboxykinase (ATP) n=1 Tax=Chlorella vulgaris TaxID=3077 RepID=A0A9D4TNM2_CHLVU|nr:hypothetical protein D9Q98_005175 [Chlorella vulgaris]